jgi:hypothetical protein
MQPTLHLPQPSRYRSAFTGPAAAAALASAHGLPLGRAVLAGALEAAPFALLVSPARKPVAYPALTALARAIHRARGEEPIETADVTLALPGEAAGRAVVGIWTLGDDGGRTRLIGYAWLGGRDHGRERLQAALLALRPRRFGEAA